MREGPGQSTETEGLLGEGEQLGLGDYLGAWSSVFVWLGEGGTCFSFTSWEDRGAAGGGEAVWVQGPFGHTGSGLGVLGWQEQHACSARRGRDPQGLEEARGVSLLLQLEECRAAGGGEEVLEWFGSLWASRAVCLLHWEREGPLRGLEDPVGNPLGVAIALGPRESSGARGRGICLLGAPLPSVALSTLPLSHLPFVLWGALLCRDSPAPLLIPNTVGHLHVRSGEAPAGFQE